MFDKVRLTISKGCDADTMFLYRPDLNELKDTISERLKEDECEILFVDMYKDDVDIIMGEDNPRIVCVGRLDDSGYLGYIRGYQTGTRNVPVEIFTGVKDGTATWAHRNHMTDPICVTKKGMEEKVAFCVEQVRKHYREKIDQQQKEWQDELKAESKIEIVLDEGLEAEFLSEVPRSTVTFTTARIKELKIGDLSSNVNIRVETVVPDELVGHHSKLN